MKVAKGWGLIDRNPDAPKIWGKFNDGRDSFCYVCILIN